MFFWLQQKKKWDLLLSAHFTQTEPEPSSAPDERKYIFIALLNIFRHQFANRTAAGENEGFCLAPSSLCSLRLMSLVENHELLNILQLARAEHVDIRAHRSALIHIQLG